MTRNVLFHCLKLQHRSHPIKKRLHLLIEAFSKCNHGDLQLVIAGDADHDTPYSQQLKTEAQKSGIVMTGYVTGEPLNQLWAGARLFVLPSSHEGLPISLLEAMSWHRDVLVSDIAANRLTELQPDDFFKTDSLEDLTNALDRKLAQPSQTRHFPLDRYDWDKIAIATAAVYTKI